MDEIADVTLRTVAQTARTRQLPVRPIPGAGRPETRAAVAMSIRRALQPYQRGKQVALAGAIWLVTAKNA
jgi:hypothetical protein